MAKGFAGTVFLTTDDCQASYEELKARGVEFTEPPRSAPTGSTRLPRPVGQPPPPDPGPRAGDALRPPPRPAPPDPSIWRGRPPGSRSGRRAGPPGAVSFDRQELELHGQRVKAYRTAGSGPALLLLHGIANSSDTWVRVAPLLSEHFTVRARLARARAIGESPGRLLARRLRERRSRPRHARGHERVTVVGHSLGGGIAMQFAYQFPERCERLVLVSTGGLGDDVRLLLRAASLPGADFVLPVLSSPRIHGSAAPPAGRPGARRAAAPRRHRSAPPRLAELDNAGSRHAFLQTRARGRRSGRPTSQRATTVSHSPPRTDADRVGRGRLDHPGRPRRRRPRRDAGQPLRRLRGTPGTCPRRPSPTTSRPC